MLIYNLHFCHEWSVDEISLRTSMSRNQTIRSINLIKKDPDKLLLQHLLKELRIVGELEDIELHVKKIIDEEKALINVPFL